ncbi:hypothetical protein V6N11_044689 [Hibiscus sabdariffa]|uniref:Uncharacterized protein n=1 Tax=Hibiscus sabdariffa TaxID=183260 RepID=A0ABR1ZLP1_9ROSI
MDDFRISNESTRLCTSGYNAIVDSGTFMLAGLTALFVALMFSSIDVDLAARRLQQLLLLPKIGLSPLPQPTIPTVLKSGSLPRLPSIPNLSSALKVTLPSFPLIPTISTTIPSIHFLFPPPLTTSS